MSLTRVPATCRGLAKYRLPLERIHSPPTPLDTTGELTQFGNRELRATMPLTRGRTIVSSGAMNHLAGTRGMLPAERKAQFLHLRDRIERIASELFDGMPMPPGGKIRIFYHHVR
ncbi:hypothetical protein [Bradyrhizobium sp.]|uniref:hypothetical protein n=1 Tax=Bradyrhizobium sp. TaxID=376 RepID=UPI003BB0C2FB